MTVKTEPDQMLTPTNGPLTGEYTIDVQWTALTSPANGDSDITSYELQYDNGSSGFVWYTLVGRNPDKIGLSYRVSTGIVPGRTYRFQVRARNAFGYGEFSPYIAIKSAVKPY